MQKCCAFDLIVNTSVAFSLVGCFCEFVFIVAPQEMDSHEGGIHGVAAMGKWPRRLGYVQ